jgi:hypothetical protein
MWLWSLPTFIVGVLVGCVRGIRAVHARLTGPVARTRRLARGTTAIVDREVVTVEGTVRTTATALTAPLSGRPCVAYHAVATLYDVVLGSRLIVGKIDEHRLMPFELVLERDGGTVTIDGDRAELAEAPRPLIPRKIELEEDFVARHDRPAELARYGGFEEAVIAVGDRVRVQGLALAEADAVAAQLYRDGAPRIRIVAHPEHPLTIGRR